MTATTHREVDVTISRVGTTTVPQVSATGTTVAPTVPTVSGGIFPTDWLVLDAWASNATAPSTPAGWTSVATNNAGGSSPSFRLCIKKAAGGEDGSTVNVTVPNGASKAAIHVYRGVDNTTPQDVAAQVFGSATGAASMTVTALTTTRAGVALHVVTAVNATAITFTRPSLPATFTEVLDEGSSPSSTMDDLIWAGSGATDAGGATVVTQSGTARFTGGMMALRPAAAPAQVGTVTPVADVGQVALSWSAPSDGGYPITDYVVQYRTNAGPGAWTTFAEGTSSSTGATVTGLDSGTAYDFQVAAVNAIGQGTYSAAVTGTPTSLSAGGAGLSRSPSRRRSRSRR